MFACIQCEHLHSQQVPFACFCVCVQCELGQSDFELNRNCTCSQLLQSCFCSNFAQRALAKCKYRWWVKVDPKVVFAAQFVVSRVTKIGLSCLVSVIET